MNKLLTLSFCLVAPLTLANGQPNLQAQQNLQAKLAQVPEFSAKFNQRVTDLDGALLQEGQGELVMAVPDRFSWQQQQPEPSVIVSDGKNVYLHDPMLEQVSIFDLNDATAQTPLSLLASKDDQAWQRYQVTEQDDCFNLVPNVVQNIERMSVCFAGNDIESVVLLDSQQIQTLMTLSQFQVGQVDRQIFQFTVPAGTFIDDQRAQ